MTGRVALFLLTVVMVVGLLAPRWTVLATPAPEAKVAPSAAPSFEPTMEASSDEVSRSASRDLGSEEPASADEETEENDGNEQDEPFNVPVLPPAPKPDRLGWFHTLKHVVAELDLPPPGSPPETFAARG